MLRIGVDATAWGNQRGYGRHLRALLGHLLALDDVNQYTLFVDDPTIVRALPEGATVVTVPATTPAARAASASGRRALPDMWRMSRALSTAELDIVLFPTVYSYVPLLTRAKKVLMIHDVIAETFPEMTTPSRKARLFWQLKVAAGRRQADAIVTVSDYSRQGIAQHFGIDPAFIHVVGEANAPIFRRLSPPHINGKLRELGIDPACRYIVFVGGFGPHKNLDRLLRAVASLVSAGPDIKLVLVGENKRESFYSEIDSLEAQIDELGLQERVLFTGFMADEDLVALLNIAAVLALPSLMEGYGLPAIEAAACGCPVVATTESPLPQLLGAGGIYVSPYDQAGLVEALARVLHSRELREQMSAAGQAAAARLTWEGAARQMLNVLQGMAAT